jgi:hypothetical protein
VYANNHQYGPPALFLRTVAAQEKPVIQVLSRRVQQAFLSTPWEGVISVAITTFSHSSSLRRSFILTRWTIRLRTKCLDNLRHSDHGTVDCLRMLKAEHYTCTHGKC